MSRNRWPMKQLYQTQAQSQLQYSSYTVFIPSTSCSSYRWSAAATWILYPMPTSALSWETFWENDSSCRECTLHECNAHIFESGTEMALNFFRSLLFTCIIFSGTCFDARHQFCVIRLFNFVSSHTRTICFHRCCTYWESSLSNRAHRATSAVTYLLVFCFIGAISASWYVQYINGIHLLPLVFSVPTTDELCQPWHQNRMGGTFEFVLNHSSRLISPYSISTNAVVLFPLQDTYWFDIFSQLATFGEPKTRRNTNSTISSGAYNLMEFNPQDSEVLPVTLELQRMRMSRCCLIPSPSHGTSLFGCWESWGKFSSTGMRYLFDQFIWPGPSVPAHT